MSALWWHATGPTASGAVNALATPATVAGFGAVPTATKLANAKTLFEAPLGLFLQDIAETSITLVWGDVLGITAYDIERNGSIIVTNWPSSQYNDIGLIPGTTYTYRVRAKP